MEYSRNGYAGALPDMSTTTEPGGPKPPPEGPPSLSSSVELAVKLATAIAGGLYILGILVSNVQFMDLGIADFAALQPRNIGVGALFALYLALWFIPWFVLGGAIYNAARSGAYFWNLLYGIPAALLAIVIGTYLFSLFYAGPSPFVLRLTADAAKFAFVGVFFKNAIDWMVGGLMLVALLAIPWAYRRIEQKKTDAVWFIVFYFGLLAVLPCKLLSYATEVYPNLRYNLGGGQPQIANVAMVGSPEDFAGVREVGLGIGIAPNAMMLEDVAIWSQSDKFLYISKASNQSKFRVLGIDIKLVRTIHSLPKYVTVTSGGRIVDLQDIPR
jgi:hypothetical protein